MSQHWEYQGPPNQGQGLQNYYPDPQYQQPPEYQHPQQQMHTQMYPQQQYAGPHQGPQFDPYQQQYPQQQYLQHQGLDFTHQQFGPQYGQHPVPQYAQQPAPPFQRQSAPQSYQPPPPHFNPQPGPYFDQQPGPQFAPQSGYQHDQQHRQLNSYNDPTFHQQSLYQAALKNFGPPPKPLIKLAKPGPATCFNCGSPDHWAMYCQEPRRVVPAGLGRPPSQTHGQPSNGVHPQAVPNQYPSQPLPSERAGNGYGYGNPQYSPATSQQLAFQHSQGFQGSPHTPISTTSSNHFSGPYQQTQPVSHPNRSSFSAPSRSVPPSPVSNVHKGHIFQRSPHPQEQSLQGTKGPPNAPAPPTRTHSTSISQPTEVRKVRAPSAEPSEEGEVSREASTVHSSRRNSIDQSVCMESEADQNATSEPASPEYEPAEPVELGEPEAQEELEEDDLEQLDVPDAPKYPGSFDAIGPQPVRFALPAKYVLYGGSLEVLQRPSPGSNGFVQSGYITRKSIMDMDCKFIDLPQYQRDPEDPVYLILHGDIRDALVTEEPEAEENAVEEVGDDGTDRSMSCDEDEERFEEDVLHTAAPNPSHSTNDISPWPAKRHPQECRSQRPYQLEVPANKTRYGQPHVTNHQTDWETEQKLAALGVTGAPKPNRMSARPWQSAEAFRQPRHPPAPPPPEPLPVREELTQLSPVWHQNDSRRHESTPGLEHIWDIPSPPRGTGTPPYIPEVHEDPVEDNPWVPPGGHEVQIGSGDSEDTRVSYDGPSNGHTENGHSLSNTRRQQSSHLPSGHRTSDSDGTFQNLTSPTSNRLPLQNGNSIGSPEESRPVWKSNATVRTSFKDRFAKINNSRKREFEPEDPSDEERGKERKRQEDDVALRMKKRQPKVAEAYSRRW